MPTNSKFKHTTNKQKKLVGTFNATRHKKAIAEKIDQSKDVVVSKSEERLLISSTYDKAQIELFNDIMQLLEVSGTKQKVGIRFVDMFCIQYKLYMDARLNVEKSGSVISVPMKYGDITKKNPAIDVMNGAFAQMMEIANKFGFHPLAQSKIKGVNDSDSKKNKESKFAGRF